METTHNTKSGERSIIRLSLRAIQALFAIIVLGLAGYVAHWWSGYWNRSSPSEINFLIFCAVWTLLVLIYLFLVELSTLKGRAAHPYAVVGVDALTMLFWFAGFIAVAVFVSNRQCLGGVCKTAKAAAVFGAFEWLLFTITTVFSALRLRHGSHTKTTPAAHV